MRKHCTHNAKISPFFVFSAVKLCSSAKHIVICGVLRFADGGRIARVEDKQQSAAWGGGELPTSPCDVELSDVNFMKRVPSRETVA